jgi:Na+/H+ antiporter NhaD/arsenite permease-like protein
MFILMVVVNSYSVISGVTCFVCLIFLFFESAFGICIGCVVYKWFYKEKAQYCPGEVCNVKAKQDIQKVSFNQVLIVAGFIAAILLMSYLLHDTFSEKPLNLWKIINTK